MRPYIRPLVLIFALLFPLFSHAANTRDITGRVSIENRDGKIYPVPNLEIHALDAQGSVKHTNVTTASGSYTFRDVPDGYKILPDNSTIAYTAKTVPAGTSTYTMNFRVPFDCGVSGTVYLDGLPANSAELKYYYKAVTHDIICDENGNYFAGCSPGGDITGLRVYRPSGHSWYPDMYNEHQIWNEIPDRDFSNTPNLTITGKVVFRGNSLSNIAIKTSDGKSTKTDVDGEYRFEVPRGWTGSVFPITPDYIFYPQKYDFSNLQINATNKNFTAYPLKVWLSGTIKTPERNPIKDVYVKPTGEPGVKTDTQGNYRVAVRGGWQGTVIPSKEYFWFEPENRRFSRVDRDHKNVDFTGHGLLTVSGYVTLEKGALPDVNVRLDLDTGTGSETLETKTDKKGFYSFTVPGHSSGTLVASLQRFIFTPEQYSFTDIKRDMQFDFTATTDFPYIAGRVTINNAGLADVKMIFDDLSGLRKTTTTNDFGYYCLILRNSKPHSWGGTLRPLKSPFQFKPRSRSYAKEAGSITGQDFVATSPYPTISGRVTVQGYGLARVKVIASALHAVKPSPVIPVPTPTPSPRPKPGPVIPRPGPISPFSLSEDEAVPNNADAISREIGDDETSGRLSLVTIETLSDENGYYSINLTSRTWSGKVWPEIRPDISSYSPEHRLYENVRVDQKNQNYKATYKGLMIAGRVTDLRKQAVSKVTLAFSGLGTVQTQPDGKYGMPVPFDWSGTVTPMKTLFVFSPPQRQYTQLKQNQMYDDYQAMPASTQMNVFTGSGKWSDVSRWSLKRLPRDGDRVQIAGKCVMNMNMPVLQSLTIKPQGMNIGMNGAYLNLRRFRIPEIPVIENEAIIYTRYRNGEPFPANRKIGGTIIFDYNYSDPPETGPRQVIPPGIYNKIILRGNKYVYVKRGTAQIDELILERGSRLGDPKQNSQGQISIKLFTP